MAISRADDRATMIGHRNTILVCSLLLIVHGAMALSAARVKSSTFDEPLHALAGYAYLQTGDFRINPEHPPLWKMFSALPHLGQRIDLDISSPFYRGALENNQVQWNWTVQTLYRTPGIDGEAFVQRSRVAMILISIALGALLMLWAYQLAGPLAAIFAGILFAFDPNFLAHAPLVTNDVALSLELLALGYILWLSWRKLNWPRVVSIGLICGLALCTKYSAVVFAPIVLFVLLRRSARFGTRREFIALPIIAVIAIAVIWISYGLRFSPGHEPSQLLDTNAIIQQIADHRAAIGQTASSDFLVTFARFTESHHLLPQAWIYGLLTSHMTTIYNPSYLLGEYSRTGWWYYFPVAIAVKTPVATFVLAIVALWAGRKYPLLLIIPLIYFVFAIASRFNIGLRHILPIYPFLFLLAGIAASNARRKWRKLFVVCAIAVIVESLAAYPNYISFFNAPARACGELKLLGDSNLDWGQDLPQLANWQREHPNETLYLSYFGTADPAAYGIKYINVPGGYDPGPEPHWPTSPGIFAISATNLQGIYASAELRAVVARIRQFPPKAVLGESIYLYDFPFHADSPESSLKHPHWLKFPNLNVLQASHPLRPPLDPPRCPCVVDGDSPERDVR